MNPLELVESTPALALLARASGLPALAVVGGAVRDWLLGRPHPDLDLVVEGDPRLVASFLRETMGGSWYVLDPVFDVVRFIPRMADQAAIDLARLQGESLQADLERRDLTINAIALPLTERGRPIAELALVDPTGGRADLDAGIVRAVSAEGLDADPVRLLRVYRFAACLPFAIDPLTRNWVGERVHKLKQPAPERIRDELFKILAAPGCAPYLADLAQIGGLEAILPELSDLRGTVSVGHFDGFAHKLETLRALEELMARLEGWAPGSGGFIHRELQTRVSGDRRKLSLLRLIALIGDLPAADAIARRLKLSGLEIRFVSRAGRARGRFEDLLEHGACGSALYRYFKAADEAAVSVALWALADFVAARDLTLLGSDEGPWAATRAVLAEAASPAVTAPREPLLRGDELRRALGLEAGPAVGRLLEAIAEARADGTIATPLEALALARTRLEADDLR